MDIVKIIAQAIVGIGIYNVWLLRSSKSTAWRGGESKSMKEEFSTYGLSEVALYIVGFLKLTFATLLIVGIWVPSIVEVAALGMCILMSGAIAMHVKIKDPLIKSLPAATLLALSIMIVLI